MDNPVDHIVDIGLVNYVKHPTNKNYVVYRFPDPERAKSFEKALKEKEIWFEKSEEVKPKVTYTLYGIHKNDFNKTQNINFDVEAKHKKPFIPFKIFRYLVILIFFGAIALALIGYFKHQEKLNSSNDTNRSINDTENVN